MSEKQFVFLKNSVESLNLNTLTQFNGYQWRCPIDSADEDGTPVEIESASFRAGDIVEVKITRYEDNGKYYRTLGIVLEEAQTCHGEYFILYGPFDDSFRYADFIAPGNVRFPSCLIPLEAESTLKDYFSQYQAYNIPDEGRHPVSHW